MTGTESFEGYVLTVGDRIFKFVEMYPCTRDEGGRLFFCCYCTGFFFPFFFICIYFDRVCGREICGGCGVKFQGNPNAFSK